jgi:hypothetical protein
MRFRLLYWLSLFQFLAIAGRTDAQIIILEDQSHKTVLDDSPVTMARSTGMAGASSGVADGVDALYYNPAGIGGLEFKAKSHPTVRQLNFPYVGASANSNSMAIQSQFSETGAANNNTIADAIVQANAGNRVYARFSLFPNIVIGRIALGVIVDNQLAAVPIGNGSLVETRYRETTGAIAGFSLTNTNRTLFLGASVASLSRAETVGQFEYSAIDNPVTRDEIFADARTNYDGMQANVGLLWRMGKRLHPTLSIVAKNLGDTHFVPSDPSKEEMIVKQNLSTGFSVTAYEGKLMQIVSTLQFDELENSNQNVNKKLKFGTELLVGEDGGSRSAFGFRAGYNSAGVSAGLQLNLGLFGLQASSYAEDVGVNNRSVIDRRQEIVIQIDVSER